MHHLLAWAKVIALVVFFFVSPFIVGSVYVGFIVIHYAAKAIINTADRLIAFIIASLTVSATLPLFTCLPIPVCIVFAGLLTWVFYPRDKRHVQPANCDENPLADDYSDAIDVEVISETTTYR